MKAITIYETDDGERFETQAGAEAHERRSKHAEKLATLLHRFDGRCWDEGGGLEPEAFANVLATRPKAAAELVSALQAICEEGKKS